MHKKLKKYIERYDILQACTSYKISPNGGMIVLINQGTDCEVTIQNENYTLEASKAMLINAYTESIQLHSEVDLDVLAVRFRGAGASFFYEEYLEVLMQSPLKPIFLENEIVVDELENYLLKRLTPSKLPFNIMKIIDLLDAQGSDYKIEELLAIANVPRKILDKMFNLRTGLTFKTYASVRESTS